MCQCIGNAYVCDTETCTDNHFDVEDDTHKNITVSSIIEKPIIISTVTPPAKCDAEK